MPSQEALSASDEAGLEGGDEVSIVPAQQLLDVSFENGQVPELSQGDQDAEARDDVVSGDVAANGVWLRLAQDCLEAVCALAH